MNVRISIRANRDIEGICDRISEENPDAADRMDERIQKAILRLANFPGIGHRRANVDDKRYLFWAIGNYVIAYRVMEKETVVVRVLHSARNFRKLFRQKE